MSGVRFRGLGAGAAALLVTTALLAQAGAVTNASWSEPEWANGKVTSLNCAAEQVALTSRGEGRVLGGSLLGIDLDNLAEASGVLVTNNGSGPTHTPAGAVQVTPPSESAWTNPLNATALRTVNVNLGNGMLQLPLDNSLGLIGQYGQAKNNARAAGASGYITNNGAVATAPANGYPELGSLSLSQLLGSINQPVANLLTNVTDVSLKVGAVTGRSQLDACDLAWNGVVPYNAATGAGNPKRDYLLSSLRTEIDSPTVGALVTTVGNLINSVDTAVANIATTNTSLVSSLVGALNTLLKNPLAGVQVTKLKATINLQPVRALLTNTITDAGGIVSISLGTGKISVDTMKLLSAAYGTTYGYGVNALPPNTELLVNQHVINTLTAAVLSALQAWVSSVETALNGAINAMMVEAQVVVTVALVAKITASVNASLATLEAPNQTGVVTTSVEVLGLDLGGVVNGLVSLLTSGLGPTVAGVVRGVLPVTTGLLTTLATPINNIVAVVSTVFTQLYLNGVVSLKVNAQNALPGEPFDWSASGVRPVPTGRYDVAALRIGVLSALGDQDVRLYLGRGSAGRW